MPVEQQLFYYIFFIPLLAGIFSALIKYANIRDALNLIFSGALFYKVIQFYLLFKQGVELKLFVAEFLPNLNIVFSVEPIGMLFLMVSSFLWFVSVLYSIGYMRENNERHQSRFYSFFALSIFTTVGVALSSNLLTLFIFYEILTIATYPLVTHAGTYEAKRAGRIYIGILLATSFLLFLPAMIISWNFAGTIDFTSGGILAGKVGPTLSICLLAMFIFGVGKAAIMPVHKWLPSAMVAPAPVSALLHAVAVVKVGVFTILKIMIYIFGIDYLSSLVSDDFGGIQWLFYVASFTIIVASIVALNQDDLKKRLAYSTISQLAYIVMSASILAQKSIIAAVFHIAAHAIAKITLFFAAGSIYTVSHKRNVSQLAGIGKRMPWTMTAFAIASFSIIGVPPTVGFLSKWYMLLGAFSQETYEVIAVMALSMILNSAYLLPIVYKAFFERERQNIGVNIERTYGEAPVLMVVAVMITTCAIIGLFFMPDVFMELAEKVVGQK